jgi:MFS family permease
MNDAAHVPEELERRFGLLSLVDGRQPFSRLAGALLISSIGDPFSLAVSLVIAYGVTHDALAIAAAYGCRTIAALVVGALAGSVTDRLDRRWLLVGLDGSRFLMLLAMPPLVAVTPYVIFPCLFLLGAAESLAQPARLAAAVGLAPPGRVEQANSLMMVSFSIAQAVGFALAGVLLILSSRPTYAYWIDSVTFLASALLVLTLPNLGGGVKTAMVQLSGLKHFARAKLRPLLLVTSGTNFFIGVATATVLPLAYVLYKDGPAAYTWLEVALIAGLVAGSLAISRWDLFRPEVLMTLAVLAFGLAALGIAATPWLATALLAFAVSRT